MRIDTSGCALPGAPRPAIPAGVVQRDLPADVETRTYRHITIRQLHKKDPIQVLTSLLRRAYERNTRNGIHYAVVTQTAEQIRAASEQGRCFVAVVHGAIVGTAMYYSPEQARGTSWYDQSSVAVVGRLATDPVYKGQRIGATLLEHIEQCAHAHGASELALDTARQAQTLVEYYKSLGYREVDEVHWQGRTFTNIVLSKAL